MSTKKKTNKKTSKKRKTTLFEWVKAWFKRLKKPSAVKKIYKTTDGYFNDKPKIKKPRKIAVVDQRKQDGAVAVVKIYSKKEKSGSAYIDGVMLTPEKHKSLTEDSIVGNRVIIGVKTGNTYRPLYSADFEKTEDGLTGAELRKIRRKVETDSPKHRQTHNKKMRTWKKRNFKK